MEPKYRFRLYLLTALVLAGCGTLLSRLYEFQIEKRSTFVANVPTTHNVSVREPGIRGQITDRKGIVLADNKRSYEVVFNLEDIYKSFQQQNEVGPEFQVEKTVKGPGGMPQNKKKKDIVRIVNEWVIPNLETLGLTGERFTKAIDTHYETHGGLVPYVYRTDLTPDEFARIAVRSNELQGVEVRVMPRRHYPYGSMACHLLGRVRQWEKIEIPKEFKKRNIHFQGDDIGITGVEATMNDHLTGEGGLRVLVRNERNKVIAVDDYQPPREGAEVQLTIDARIQYLVENVLRRVGRGAAVVMDPRTGEVLAMASVPNFDPNDFIPSIAQDKWSAYTKKGSGNALINRAISSFTPGSTFKLPTSIAMLMNDRAGYHHRCIGHSTFGRKKERIHCWKRSGHGSLGLSEAIQRSCNPYFMSMAGQLKSRVMVDTFTLLNLGRKTGIQLPQEAPGIVPGNQLWKRKNPGAKMTQALLAQMSIGQSASLATPLQICGITATIANGGRYYQPRIIRRVIGTNIIGEEEIIIENIPKVKVNLLKEGVTTKELQIIRKGMWKSVNERGGTAGRVKMKDVELAAKTGTAQVNKLDPKNTHNAWTASFGPYDSPRYAIVVMVRNGKSGGAVAGALTHLIYRGIFALEAGLKPRLTRMGIYKGHFEPIKEIELPEGNLLTLTIADEGETGNEVDAALHEAGQPIKVKPRTIPLPSITPLPDSATPNSNSSGNE